MRSARHRAGCPVQAVPWLGAALAFAALLSPTPSGAETIKLGLVKVANSGATYIAKEKGYFAAEGIDAELVFFDGGGVAVTVAVVSGDVGYRRDRDVGPALHLGRTGRAAHHWRRDPRSEDLPQFRALRLEQGL